MLTETPAPAGNTYLFERLRSAVRLLLAGGNLEKVSSEKLKEELLDIPELRERMMLIVPHPCRWSCRGGAELFRFQPSAAQPA